MRRAVMPPPELHDRPTFLSGFVQQNDHLAGQMAKQFAQEQADLILPDAVVEEQRVEIPPAAAGLRE
jgi:hypothetical protein